jgi:hypothetical protein
VTGYTGTAFTLEGKNAKNLGLHRCHRLGMFDRHRTGKYAIDTSTYPGRGAAFFWSDGLAIGHEEADFKIGECNDTIKIDGVVSEKSARMLQMLDRDADGTVAYPLLLKNYRFGTGDTENPPAADGEVIQCDAMGPLTIIACKIGLGIGRQQLRIRYAPASGGFNFIGNAIGNDGDRQVFTAAPPAHAEGNLGFRQGIWRPL